MNIICAGEVMLEFIASDRDNWVQSFGGDTFNTAIYLARAGVSVGYLTALGDDAFSTEVIERLRVEQVDVSLVEQKNNRQIGLYTINNDGSGEREFSYWRSNSPARELFDQPVSLPLLCDAFYFTGITLAVMQSGLANIVDLLKTLREQNCKIIFDPNYRPKLWSSAIEARNYYHTVLQYCDVVLSSLEDEEPLWGVNSVAECKDHYDDFDLDELVIKTSDLSCHVFSRGALFESQAAKVSAVDTTGAGDSFNAAYIAARYQGELVDLAVLKAQLLSAKVVQCRGAII